eukprot:GHVP01001130.1.p1 GENE.GHVP01001130.1~~GHVP01001130.1.p1  ORF type:complete len:145 (+),score=7.20 GHVP01001130.1:105-539(+)
MFGSNALFVAESRGTQILLPRQKGSRSLSYGKKIEAIQEVDWEFFGKNCEDYNHCYINREEEQKSHLTKIGVTTTLTVRNRLGLVGGRIGSQSILNWTIKRSLKLCTRGIVPVCCCAIFRVIDCARMPFQPKSSLAFAYELVFV